MAGTAVDLLFFPIDTLKTRLQSVQGFVRTGGFKGIYKGVGSVIVGSAPGGELTNDFTECIIIYRMPAAAFFSTYDTLKKHTPLPPQYAPITHMASASVGEIVRIYHPAIHPIPIVHIRVCSTAPRPPA